MSSTNSFLVTLQKKLNLKSIPSEESRLNCKTVDPNIIIKSALAIFMTKIILGHAFKLMKTPNVMSLHVSAESFFCIWIANKTCQTCQACQGDGERPPATIGKPCQYSVYVLGVSRNR